MITIAQAVGQTISSSSLFGEALIQDVVNYSALARKIKPAVEEILLEPVTEGAVTIALKRLGTELRKSRKSGVAVYPIRNITLRSSLTTLIYQNSPILQDIHQKILHLKDTEDPFVHFAQGSHESSFLVSENCVASLKKLAAKERLVAEYPRLSAISVRMPPEVMQMPGVFAPFVQTLAWQQISVYQIVSHFTEIAFVVSDMDADKAFGAIKALSGSRK
jgi:aspartokinase